MSEELLTVEQAAEIAKCTAANIRKAINRKKLPATKFGERPWAIKRLDLEAWIDNAANHKRGRKAKLGG